jgi:hypothetical protein
MRTVIQPVSRGPWKASTIMLVRRRICTWATGGKANLRDSSGVACESSCCSSYDWPSSACAGRVYWATNESMVRVI